MVSEQTGSSSSHSSDDRDRIAEDRDKRAEQHDQASEDRDSRASGRDERAEVREHASDGRVDPGARADRRGAMRDRQGGASDRSQSADDRNASSADRAESAKERATASMDELTNAYRRESGLVELEREVTRARRTKHPFTLAFVDVDDLKAVNDSCGHLAGDRLLRSAADSLKAHLRDYDLTVRFGGDEFVCGLSNMIITQAAERFARVNADLASQGASLSVGLAELHTDEVLEHLLERADQALYAEKKRRRSPA